MVIEAVSREQVIGFRAWAQGLDRRPGGVDRAAALGLQDTPYGSAATAFQVRGATGVPVGGRGAPVVWTWRGAPHAHRPEDLGFLAEALWPVSDEDARRRIATTSIKQGARRGLAAFDVAARAMREVVTGRMSKGEVSRAVSERIPADLCFDCGPCAARHVSGALFQQVGVAAGVGVVVEGRSTFLEPLPDDVRLPGVPVEARRTGEALVRYLRVLGPAGPAELASFLGTTVGVVREHVGEPVGDQAGEQAGGLAGDRAGAGLVEVGTPSGPALIALEDLPRLRSAERPRATRLLPPGDPWLQARDRTVILPDAARHKAVWRAIANPGAVLADGEIVGTWRAKAGRRGVLEVTVEPFGTLPARVRRELEAEATGLAAHRGAADVSVVVPG